MLENIIKMNLNLNTNDIYEVIIDYLEYNIVKLEDVEYIESLGFDINEFNEYLLD